MSYSNVGMGMVPCKKNCRCDECVIDRQRDQIKDLQTRLDDLESIIRGDSLTGPQVDILNGLLHPERNPSDRKCMDPSGCTKHGCANTERDKQ